MARKGIVLNYEAKLQKILQNMHSQFTDGRDDDSRQFEAYALEIRDLFRYATRQFVKLK